MYSTLLFPLLGVVFLHQTVAIEYSPVGCFRDDLRMPRPLGKLIKNYRGNLDWFNLSKVVDMCAKEANAKGFLYFGIQFYGECWSGPLVHETYNRSGFSKRCKSGVGGPNANFVYMLHGEENECANYKVLNESDRSQTNHTSVTALKCDHWIYNFEPDRWNRFEGAAGQTMALKPVAPYRCSSIMSGWMNDKHPEVIEGIQSKRVCFSSKRSSCDRFRNIRVRNCGKFYVYYLPITPGCMLRYCGSGENLSSLKS